MFRSISALRREKEQERSIFKPLKLQPSFSLEDDTLHNIRIAFRLKTSGNALLV